MGVGRAVISKPVLISFILFAVNTWAGAPLCERWLRPARFDRDLPLVSPIKSQCGPSCAVEAVVSVYEQRLFQQTRAHFEIASGFVLAHAYFEQAVHALSSPRGEFPGGFSVEEVVQTIQKNGLVLKPSWQPTFSTERLFRDYQWVVEAFRKKSGRLSPLLRTKARKDAQAALQQVRDTYLGDVEVLQPHQFVKRYFPRVQLVQLERGADSDEALDAMITKEIDQERSVVIAIEWIPELINLNTGVMAYQESVPYEAREHARHALIVLGYRRNEQGQLEWLKLRNSYGSQIGEKGIFHLHQSYLSRFAIDFTRFVWK